MSPNLCWGKKRILKKQKSWKSEVEMDLTKKSQFFFLEEDQRYGFISFFFPLKREHELLPEVLFQS